MKEMHITGTDNISVIDIMYGLSGVRRSLCRLRSSRRCGAAERDQYCHSTAYSLTALFQGEKNGEKIIYVAHAIATGGRNGNTETDDGTLKLSLASPGEAGVKPGTTNPEQLFACTYAACFGSALEFAARQQGVTLSNPEVHVDIALNKNEEGFFIGATLNVVLPGIEKDQAEKIVQAAHQVCPYSKATRGNIEVVLKINEPSLQEAA